MSDCFLSFWLFFVFFDIAPFEYRWLSVAMFRKFWFSAHRLIFFSII